jgi:hypothetical protein
MSGVKRRFRFDFPAAAYVSQASVVGIIPDKRKHHAVDALGDGQMPGRKKYLQSAAKAMSREKSSWLGGCFLFVFFGIFFTAGCVAFFFMFVRPVVLVAAARDWVERQCVIVSSQVGSHSGDDGTNYSIDIEFKYFVDDKEYQSDRYSFDTMASSGRKGKQRVVDQYPVGSENICYVDLGDPHEAVLNRKFVPTLWFGLFPLIFIAVGGGGLLVGTWVLLKKGGPSRTSKTEWLPDDQQTLVEKSAQLGYASQPAPGPVTLKPAASPWGKLAGALVFAAIWNGVTSIFVTIAVVSHLKGDPEWFLTIFIIPFVLVGIGVLLYLAYSILALFNPKPVITVSSRSVRLGESLQLSWLFDGKASSLRKLTISVCGQESATYRQGTSTYTDTNDFLEIPVAEAADFFNIHRGEAEVQIPSSTMHSFESGHNKITWSINVKGEIAMWPDVNNSYPLLVLP